MKPYGYVSKRGDYVVVYPYPFDLLQCDHGTGSIAYDLFDSTGDPKDYLVCCPRDLNDAHAFAERYW